MNMNGRAQEIFDNVIEAMQDAEEIWGPGDDGYIPLMAAIANEANERIQNFSLSLIERDREAGNVLLKLRRRAMGLEG